jgi:hypothetical protein
LSNTGVEDATVGTRDVVEDGDRAAFASGTVQPLI